MLKKIALNVIQCSIAASVLISGISFAADHAASKNNLGVPKDKWIKEFKLQAPAAICNRLINGKTTRIILKTHNITYKKCVSEIPKNIDRCGHKYFVKLPTSLKADEGKKWGSEIGKCIGVDFYNNYIAGHK